MDADLDKFKRLQTLPVSAVVLDSTGTIVGVNDAWKSFGERNGLCVPDFGIGANYLTYCGPDRDASPTLADDLRDVLAGRRDMVTMIYPCHSPTVQRWFFLIGFPLSLKQVSRRRDPARRADEAIAAARLVERFRAEGRTGRSGLMSRIADTVEASVSGSLASQLAAMMQEPSDSACHHPTDRHGKRGSRAQQAADANSGAARRRQDQRGDRQGAVPVTAYDQAARVGDPEAAECQEPDAGGADRFELAAQGRGWKRGLAASVGRPIRQTKWVRRWPRRTLIIFDIAALNGPMAWR